MAAGGFTLAFVQLIANAFMSTSETTPPNSVGTPHPAWSSEAWPPLNYGVLSHSSNRTTDLFRLDHNICLLRTLFFAPVRSAQFSPSCEQTVPDSLLSAV